MPQYKKRGINLDKHLSPYLSIFYQKPMKYSMEYFHLFIECGSKCKAVIDLLNFHYDF